MCGGHWKKLCLVHRLLLTVNDTMGEVDLALLGGPCQEQYYTLVFSI